MPLSGNTYVAPNWVDGGPPALDAAELQAMCDAIVQNQGDASALQAAVQALTTTVSGKAQIATGSYVGTGTYGRSNPNTLEFDTPPKAVLISQTKNENYTYFMLWFYGSGYAIVFNPRSGPTSAQIGNLDGCIVPSSVTGTTLSWYSPADSMSQMNNNTYTYDYIAIG